MQAERSEGQRPYIRGIEDDGGRGVQMNLIVEDDGDVIITMRDVNDPTKELVMEFNNSQGAAHHPLISRELSRLAELLYLEKNDPGKLEEVLGKELVNRLINE